MAKSTTPAFHCTECGWTATKWVGRCGECQAWGTVEEVGSVRARTTAAQVGSSPAVPIGAVDVAAARAVPTGIDELDRVLGGGLVAGAVVLLAGEPGVGKSTLLLDTAATWARTGRRVLYATGEESAAQVRLRPSRRPSLGCGEPRWMDGSRSRRRRSGSWRPATGPRAPESGGATLQSRSQNGHEAPTKWPGVTRA